MHRLGNFAINDSGFAFDPSTGETFTLNPTARVILAGLGRGDDPALVAEALVDAFEVTASDALRDVNDFTQRLNSLGFK